MNIIKYNCDDISLNYSIDKKPNPDNFFLHTHDNTEIFIFLDGKGVYHVEGNRYPVSKGDILIMRKNESHYIEISKNYSYKRISINFNDRIFDSIDKNFELSNVIYKRTAGIDNVYHKSEFEKSIYEYALNILSNKNDLSRFRIIYAIIMLLNEINKIHISHHNLNTNNEYPLSHKVLSYINKNLYSDMSLESIAKEFFISKATLNRIIKKSTGATPWSYITLKRLYKAKELLISGEKPSKVCFNCGFTDYSAFYRAYIKQFGFPPSNK